MLFAGTGFADDAEGLAAFDSEVDVIDNTAWLPLPRTA